LEFVVIEFNKDAKKIVLSHTRTFDDTQETPAPVAKPAKTATKKTSTGSNTDDAVKAINKGNEKSTLGDLDALAGLKEKMEKGE
jgi:small subunit ribosomal protein S1